jgi:hypothetical protein
MGHTKEAKGLFSYGFDGLTFQISFAYCVIVRSLEKNPLLAV